MKFSTFWSTAIFQLNYWAYLWFTDNNSHAFAGDNGWATCVTLRNIIIRLPNITRRDAMLRNIASRRVCAVCNIGILGHGFASVASEKISGRQYVQNMYLLHLHLQCLSVIFDSVAVHCVMLRCISTVFFFATSYDKIPIIGIGMGTDIGPIHHQKWHASNIQSILNENRKNEITGFFYRNRYRKRPSLIFHFLVPLSIPQSISVKTGKVPNTGIDIGIGIGPKHH